MEKKNISEEMERKIKNDIYATERFRVIGMVENSPDFANDFQCTRLENKCVIW
jgi:predicted metalloendopeptidase